MAVITITFTGSDEQIIDGIPRYMTIESNVPSTIYFTLDGTTPTVDSPVYIETFEMPDGRNSVIVSAYAIDSEFNSSPILTQVFAPDTSRISVSRHTGQEGFVLNRADMGNDTPTGYDADGNPARFIDVDIETLDFVRSTRGYLGIAEGTAIEVNIPDPSDTPSLIDDNFVPYSTPRVGEFFHPEARLIVIDNREDNDLNITLRPYGSLHNIYKEFGGKRIREAADDAAYISGGFARRFYDAEKNVMVSYYFDHNEGRYVKNIQELPSGVHNAHNIGVQSISQPLVFQWIYRGRQSSI
jgi:hypothetical protein